MVWHSGLPRCLALYVYHSTPQATEVVLHPGAILDHEFDEGDQLCVELCLQWIGENVEAAPQQCRARLKSQIVSYRDK